MKKYYHSQSTIKILDAVQRNDTSSVQILLSKDLDLLYAADERGYSAIHWAAYVDSVEITDILLNHSVDIAWKSRTLRGQNSLHIACSNDSYRVVRRLIDFAKENRQQENFDDINNYGESAAHIAAASGKCTILQILMSAGLNFQIKDKWGRTPRQVSINLQYSNLDLIVSK